MAEVSGAADRVLAMLRQTGSDPGLALATQRLTDLVVQALSEAEQDGMRRLARTIPHELDQPLAEIRGYAELLLEREFTPEQRDDLLGRVARAAIRLGELVHAIGAVADRSTPTGDNDIIGHDLVDVAREDSATRLAAGPLAELHRSALTRLDVPPDEA